MIPVSDDGRIRQYGIEIVCSATLKIIRDDVVKFLKMIYSRHQEKRIGYSRYFLHFLGLHVVRAF